MSKRAKAKRVAKSLNNLVKQVKANTAMLKQTVEGKQSYYSTSQLLGNSSFNTFDIFSSLSQGVADTASGTSVSDGARIGNSINLKHMSGRILIDSYRYGGDPANPAVKSGGMHRVIVYNSPCGEVLNAADILRDGTSAFAAMRSPYRVDIEQGKMYQIWLDKTFFLSDAKPAVLMNLSKKWKNGHKVIYDDNNGTPSNFRPRLLVISEDVPPTTGNVLSMTIKSKYEDL